jgi:TolB-like protein
MAEEGRHTGEGLDRKAKKRNKVRSAWISFVGRIVAQLVGAAATIVLGLMIADRIHQDPATSPPAATPAVTVPPVAPPGDGRVSIAVLPMQNLSGDAGQEHLADAMTEALIADLAKAPTLRVISRTSVMPYKGAQKPLPAIARELGADMVIEGSVLREGRRVRVIAQLIEAAGDRHLWAESYDGDGRDVLGLQRDMVRTISAEVQVVLAEPPEGPPTTP